MRTRTILICIFAAGLAGYSLLALPTDDAGTASMPARDATPTAVPEPPMKEAIRRDIRNVTPPGMLQAPKLEGETILREPAKTLPKPPPRPPKPDLYARPTVEAAGVLRSGETSIRIARIDAIAADESCAGSDGRPWPCGIHARTALQRLIRQRTISCDPGGVPDGSGGIARHCAVGGVDIGRWLVEQGWAVPDGRDDLSGALQAARESKRGQWGDPPR
jgi:endonuclease YncB( thermonuclease family)